MRNEDVPWMSREEQHARNQLKIAIKKRNVWSFNRLIAESGKQRLLNVVYDAYDTLCSIRGLSPNVYTFTNMVNACVRCGELDRAKKLVYEDMPQHNISPNAITYTALLKGICSDEATTSGIVRSVLSEMCAKQIAPNLRTFNTILRGCVRTGDADFAVEMYAFCPHILFHSSAHYCACQL